MTAYLVYTFINKMICSSGVRDYIHVMDLASGHIAALKKLQAEHLTLKVRQFLPFTLISYIM